ncbi:MAG: hypothetical protein J6I76_13150 [Oribacterium sp.]|nr:hypothetical protein [Oribacterium sp.]
MNKELKKRTLNIEKKEAIRKALILESMVGGIESIEDICDIDLSGYEEDTVDNVLDYALNNMSDEKLDSLWNELCAS